ncbi:hypothetical protein AB6A40_003888 [Gnathostoma spinigerum]|uniref:Uncharacterized protein n=1 Tax=Gnathostoma spinigerum TaxID=75299 RepID=A0ABD6EIK8_9BILA
MLGTFVIDILFHCRIDDNFISATFPLASKAPAAVNETEITEEKAESKETSEAQLADEVSTKEPEEKSDDNSTDKASAEESSEPHHDHSSTEAPKSEDEGETTEAPKPEEKAETTGTTEAEGEAETTEATESESVTETTEAAKPKDEAKTTEAAKSKDEVETTETPEGKDEVKSAEAPTPKDEVKSTEAPEPKDEVKTTETPKQKDETKTTKAPTTVKSTTLKSTTKGAKKVNRNELIPSRILGNAFNYQSCVTTFEVVPNADIASFKHTMVARVRSADHCAYLCYRDACTAAVFSPSTVPGERGYCKTRFDGREKCSSAPRSYYVKPSKAVFLQCFRCESKPPVTKAPVASEEETEEVHGVTVAHSISQKEDHVNKDEKVPEVLEKPLETASDTRKADKTAAKVVAHKGIQTAPVSGEEQDVSHHPTPASNKLKGHDSKEAPASDVISSKPQADFKASRESQTTEKTREESTDEEGDTTTAASETGHHESEEASIAPSRPTEASESLNATSSASHEVKSDDDDRILPQEYVTPGIPEEDSPTSLAEQRPKIEGAHVHDEGTPEDSSSQPPAESIDATNKSADKESIEGSGEGREGGSKDANESESKVTTAPDDLTTELNVGLNIEGSGESAEPISAAEESSSTVSTTSVRHSTETSEIPEESEAITAQPDNDKNVSSLKAEKLNETSSKSDSAEENITEAPESVEVDQTKPSLGVGEFTAEVLDNTQQKQIVEPKPKKISYANLPEFTQGCIVTFQADPISERPPESNQFEATTTAKTAEICAGRCYQDGCTSAIYNPHNKLCTLTYSGTQICNRGKHNFFYRATEVTWIHCTSCRHSMPEDEFDIRIDPSKLKPTTKPPVSEETLAEFGKNEHILSVTKAPSKIPSVIEESITIPKSTNVIHESTKLQTTSSQLESEGTESPLMPEATTETRVEYTKTAALSEASSSKATVSSEAGVSVEVDRSLTTVAPTSSETLTIEAQHPSTSIAHRQEVVSEEGVSETETTIRSGETSSTTPNPEGTDKVVTTEFSGSAITTEVASTVKEGETGSTSPTDNLKSQVHDEGESLVTLSHQEQNLPTHVPKTPTEEGYVLPTGTTQAEIQTVSKKVSEEEAVEEHMLKTVTPSEGGKIPELETDKEEGEASSVSKSSTVPAKQSSSLTKGEELHESTTTASVTNVSTTETITTEVGGTTSPEEVEDLHTKSTTESVAEETSETLESTLGTPSEAEGSGEEATTIMYPADDIAKVVDEMVASQAADEATATTPVTGQENLFGHDCLIMFQTSTKQPTSEDLDFVNKTKAESADECARKCYETGCVTAKFDSILQKCEFAFGQLQICDDSQMRATYESEGLTWIHCTVCQPLNLSAITEEKITGEGLTTTAQLEETTSTKLAVTKSGEEEVATESPEGSGESPSTEEIAKHIEDEKLSFSTTSVPTTVGAEESSLPSTVSEEEAVKETTSETSSGQDKYEYSTKSSLPNEGENAQNETASSAETSTINTSTLEKELVETTATTREETEREEVTSGTSTTIASSATESQKETEESTAGEHAETKSETTTTISHGGKTEPESGEAEQVVTADKSLEHISEKPEGSTEQPSSAEGKPEEEGITTQTPQSDEKAASESGSSSTEGIHSSTEKSEEKSRSTPSSEEEPSTTSSTEEERHASVSAEEEQSKGGSKEESHPSSVSNEEKSTSASSEKGSSTPSSHEHETSTKSSDDKTTEEQPEGKHLEVDGEIGKTESVLTLQPEEEPIDVTLASNIPEEKSTLIPVLEGVSPDTGLEEATTLAVEEEHQEAISRATEVEDEVMKHTVSPVHAGSVELDGVSTKEDVAEKTAITSVPSKEEDRNSQATVTFKQQKTEEEEDVVGPHTVLPLGAEPIEKESTSSLDQSHEAKLNGTGKIEAEEATLSPAGRYHTKSQEVATEDEKLETSSAAVTSEPVLPTDGGGSLSDEEHSTGTHKTTEQSEFEVRESTTSPDQNLLSEGKEFTSSEEKSRLYSVAPDDVLLAHMNPHKKPGESTSMPDDHTPSSTEENKEHTTSLATEVSTDEGAGEIKVESPDGETSEDKELKTLNHIDEGGTSSPPGVTKQDEEHSTSVIDEEEAVLRTVGPVHGANIPKTSSEGTTEETPSVASDTTVEDNLLSRVTFQQYESTTPHTTEAEVTTATPNEPVVTAVSDLVDVLHRREELLKNLESTTPNAPTNASVNGEDGTQAAEVDKFARPVDDEGYLNEGTAPGCDGRIEFQVHDVQDELNTSSTINASSPADCARKCYSTRGCMTAIFVPGTDGNTTEGVCKLTEEDKLCSEDIAHVPQHASIAPFVISCLRCSPCKYSIVTVLPDTELPKFGSFVKTNSLSECAEECGHRKCTIAEFNANTLTVRFRYRINAPAIRIAIINRKRKRAVM